MNWYYALAQKQHGPVTDDQLRGLVKDGVVTGDTLVWRDGLANWQPYRLVAGPAEPTPSPMPAIPVAADAPASRPMAACRLEFEYAGFWIRFCAKIIDGLVIGIPIGILTGVVMAAMGGFAVMRRGGEASALLILAMVGLDLLGMVLTVLYNTLLVGSWGTTLGKKVCGLKVVRQDGAKVSYGRACGRAFAEILSRMACYIGYIIAGFDDQKRSLHDHMCDTRVVKAR